MPPAKHLATQRKTGFTLIELSIVLVIIGLLVGGVFAVRGMQEAAELRAQSTQVEQIVTATGAFRLKYGAIPGDISNAVSMGLGTSTSLHNGNGNGFLGCTERSMQNNKESENFLMHLISAGMYAGNFEGYDGASGVYVAADLDRHYPRTQMKGVDIAWLIPARFIGSGAYPCDSPLYQSSGNGFSLLGIGTYFAAVMPSPLTLALDTKFDDGLPLSGKITNGSNSVGSYVHTMGLGNIGDSICGNVAGTNVYSNASVALCAQQSTYCCKPAFVNQF